MSPTPEQVKAARKRAKLTQLQAAMLIYASKRAWQTWESSGAAHRDMPEAKWHLFNIKVKGI